MMMMLMMMMMMLMMMLMMMMMMMMLMLIMMMMMMMMMMVVAGAFLPLSDAGNWLTLPGQRVSLCRKGGSPPHGGTTTALEQVLGRNGHA